MKETLKYIEVLNWGYSGFAPMTLGQNFEKSLQQVQERLALLDGLDYGALFVEATSANGKANLLKYQSTDDTIEYSLHFMRDRGQLLEALKADEWEIENGEKVIKKNPKRLFRGFYDAIDEYKADGVWTDEQWREYRVTLSMVEKGFQDRLRQFATAYDYPLSDVPNSPEPQQKDLHYYCSKAIEKGYLVKIDGGYRRTKEWTKAQLAYFLNHFLNAGKTFPDKKYCVMFGESRLSKAADQLNININGGGKPRGYEIVDELLQE